MENEYPQFLHGIPWMAKEPGVALQTPVTHEQLNISWEEVIHKRVMTSDTVDIGDVEKVGNEFIVVREGVGKQLYIIYLNHISTTMMVVVYSCIPVD